MHLVGAEPFFLPGGRHGVLLIHGFTGLPAELRLLGAYLNERGFTVLAIRLAGHGTTVEDLSRMEHEDWTPCATAMRFSAARVIESPSSVIRWGLSLPCCSLSRRRLYTSSASVRRS